jgi:hypothetical protein
MKKLILIIGMILLLTFSFSIFAKTYFFNCECNNFKIQGGQMKSFQSNLNKNICTQEFFIIDGEANLFFARGTPVNVIENSKEKLVAKQQLNEDFSVEFKLTKEDNQWLIKEKFNLLVVDANWVKRDFRCEIMSDEEIATSAPMKKWKAKLKMQHASGRDKLIQYCVANGFEDSERGLQECGNFIQLEANLKNTQNTTTNNNNNQNAELKSLTKENQELLKKNQEMLRKARQVQHYQGLSRMMQSFQNSGLF